MAGKAFDVVCAYHENSSYAKVSYLFFSFLRQDKQIEKHRLTLKLLKKRKQTAFTLEGSSARCTQPSSTNDLIRHSRSRRKMPIVNAIQCKATEIRYARPMPRRFTIIRINCQWQPTVCSVFQVRLSRPFSLLNTVLHVRFSIDQSR